MSDRARAGACQQLFAAMAAAVGFLVATPVEAAELHLVPQFRDRLDFFGGIDGASDSMFAWSGLTYAPRGRLDEDGFRIRVAGGVGIYRYRTGNVPGGANEAGVMSGELLGGYRRTFGRAIVSGYLGFHIEEQRLRAPDPSNPTAGTEAGIKGTIDVYSRLWAHYVATAFATGSTVHGKYNIRGAFQREFNERWAAGLETAFLGDARANEVRVGPVVSLTWHRKIVALSAGFLDNSDKGSGGYGTLSVYSPF